MWVQLLKPKTVEQHGRSKAFRKGEVVEVGKQMAIGWINANEAVAVYCYSPLAAGPEYKPVRPNWEIPGEFMTMFTIPREFTSNKPHVASQRNAIGSWANLSQRPEIILMCDDAGVMDAAKEYKCNYVPGVGRSSHRVPFLSSAFRLAVEVANYGVMCYANSDIIFTDSLVDAARIASREFTEFLMVGRRRGIELGTRLTFGSDWQYEISKQCGPLDDASAMDYFVFTRQAFEKMGMLNFIVGSPAWDNWLLAQALKLDIPTIDASNDVWCIHGNHDRKWPRFGIDHNRGLACGVSAIITDTKYVLRGGKLEVRQ